MLEGHDYKRAVVTGVDFGLTIQDAIDVRQSIEDEVRETLDLIENPDGIPLGPVERHLIVCRNRLEEWNKFNDEQIFSLWEKIFKRLQVLEREYELDYEKIAPVIYKEYPNIILLLGPILPEIHLRAGYWPHIFSDATFFYRD